MLRNTADKETEQGEDKKEIRYKNESFRKGCHYATGAAFEWLWKFVLCVSFTISLVAINEET